jgi:hypothetical protein
LRGLGAEGVENVGLEGEEFLVGDGLGLLIARDVDVDDTSGLDVGREEDRWEFYLQRRRFDRCPV